LKYTLDKEITSTTKSKSSKVSSNAIWEISNLHCTYQICLNPNYLSPTYFQLEAMNFKYSTFTFIIFSFFCMIKASQFFTSYWYSVSIYLYICKYWRFLKTSNSFPKKPSGDSRINVLSRMRIFKWAKYSSWLGLSFEKLTKVTFWTKFDIFSKEKNFCKSNFCQL